MPIIDQAVDYLIKNNALDLGQSPWPTHNENEEISHKELGSKISQAATAAGKALFYQGIFTRRPNEAGNEIELYCKIRQTCSDNPKVFGATRPCIR
jgi:hypothetical protein